MENKANALAAGIFVLAITALLVIMAFWLGRDNVNLTTYELISDKSITGLQPQAAVRFKGVSVGKVTSISFDPAHPSNVLIKIGVDPTAPITGATEATLAYQGITGLSFVQLSDDGLSSEAVTAGPNGTPRIPLKPNALGELSESADVLMGKVNDAADKVNTLLSDENQKSMMDAIASINGAAASVDQLAQTSDKTLKAQFDPAKTNIPALVAQAQATLKATEKVAQDANRMLGTVTGDARKMMDTINGAASKAQQGLASVTGEGGLVQRLDQGAQTVTQNTLPRIQQLAAEASQTMQKLEGLTNSLRENPQALIYGSGSIPPGPGESGFQPPAPAAKSPANQPNTP